MMVLGRRLGSTHRKASCWIKTAPFLLPTLLVERFANSQPLSHQPKPTGQLSRLRDNQTSSVVPTEPITTQHSRSREASRSIMPEIFMLLIFRIITFEKSRRREQIGWLRPWLDQLRILVVQMAPTRTHFFIIQQ